MVRRNCGVLRRRVLSEPRQPEIEHFDRSIGAQHDIRRFQIAMHDAGLVRRSKSREDLPRDPYRFFLRQPAPCDDLRQRLSANQLGGNERSAFEFADFKYGHDVRVIQRRRQASLALEAAPAFGIQMHAGGNIFNATSRRSFRSFAR